MRKQELLRKIKRSRIVKKGQFKLRSGAVSNLYLDVRKLFGNPSLLYAISDSIQRMLPNNTTCVVGSGYGGLPFATAVALTSKIKLVAVRNEIKDHGINKPIEGYIPTRKDRVVIIDDLFTTGSSMLETAKRLKKTNAKIIGAIVVVKRAETKNFSIPLQHLFMLDDILN